MLIHEIVNESGATVSGAVATVASNITPGSKKKYKHGKVIRRIYPNEEKQAKGKRRSS